MVKRAFPVSTLSRDDLVSASTAFHAALDQTRPGARIFREWPVELRRKRAGQVGQRIGRFGSMPPRRNKAERNWRSVLTDAEDVLARRVCVRAPDLVALIHEVNPSGRDLRDDVRTERYALKSRLQSLLIREFGGELAVEVLEGGDHTVGLRYLPQDRDACHAVLDELNPDARAWVRLRLDLEHGEEKDAPPLRASATAGATRSRASSRPSAGSLEAGRRALEDYDFDGARAAFQEAFEASEGAPPAAVALLELLVDQLAAYGEALALAEGLSPESARVPGVRERVATAAAHEAAAEIALRWLEGASPSATAETLVVLARQLLARGELNRTAELVEKARATDPTCGPALLLADELARRRASARAPMEAELERVHALGDDAVTEVRARALLATFPDSPVAGRILRAIEARRSSAEAARLRHRGDEAFSAGNFVQAAQLFRQAEALGDASASERLAGALRAEEASNRRRRIDAVLAALGEGIRLDELEAFLKLAPDERDVVRATVNRPELAWAERADPAAALALASASVCSLPESFEEVLRLLEPHARVLKRIPEAEQLIEEARAARDKSLLDRTHLLLAGASEAIERGVPEDAVSLLENAGYLSQATADVRARASELLGRARTLLERRRSLEQFEALRAAGRGFEAMELASRCERPGGPGQSQAWRERRVALGRTLRDSMALEIVEEPESIPLPELGDDRPSVEDVTLSVDESGATHLLAVAYGRWLFLQEWDVHARKLRRLLSLRAPGSMSFPDVWVHGETVVVTSADGGFLELSRVDGSVLRWKDVSGLSGDDETLEQLLVIPGTRLLWTMLRRKDQGDTLIRIHDLDRDRGQREIELGYFILPVPSPQGMRVLAKDLERARLSNESGSALSSIPGGVSCLCVRPDGRGYVGLRQLEEEDAAELQIVLLGESGNIEQEIELPDGWIDTPHSIAASVEQGRVYTLHEQGDEKARVLGAWELAEGRLRQRYENEVSRGAWLAQDVGARRVLLVVAEEQGEEVHLLGDAPPRLRGGSFEAPTLPTSSGGALCDRRPFDRTVFAEADHVHRRPTGEARARALDELLRSRGDDVKALLQVAHELRFWDCHPEADRVYALLERSFASEPIAMLQLASDAAGRGDWSAVVHRLESVRLTDKDEAHRAHLLGEAYFHLERLQEARETFAYGSAIGEDPCSLKAWGPWLDAFGDPQPGDASEPPGPRRVLWAIREADRLLDAGEGRAAKAVLDGARTWSLQDLNVLARHAEAVLLVGTDSPTTRFRKRLVLAGFMKALEDEVHSPGRRVPLGRIASDRTRVEDVAARAREWLDGSARRG